MVVDNFVKDDVMGAEIYDPRTDTWSAAHATVASTRVTSRSSPQRAANVIGNRQQFAVGVDDGGVLYVIGGRDGLKTVNHVNAFDPRTGQWTVQNGLGTQRHGLG